MKEKTINKIKVLKIFQNGIFKLVRALQMDCRAVEGRMCMEGSDGRFCFSRNEEERSLYGSNHE